MKVRLSRSVSRGINRINRIFNIVLGALAMLIVALVSAFITMRLAIHGHEVKVPDLTNLTLSEASKKTTSLGLSLSLENRFYSPNTQPGRVLAQSPAPGLTVRREWPVRVTESLGAQQVAIPDLLGQTERTASINIRRLGLELGTVSHIASPGEPGTVIAQTPTPNASGVDRPRVSLLLSDPETGSSPQAFVMPSLAGLTLTGAAARAASAGLHIASAEDLNLNATSATAPLSAQWSPAATTPSYTEPIARTVSSIGTVIAQTPPAGHRVVKGDAVHITLTD
ncbi:PASTA domain-containing protein [Granulicella sp. S190]|uniref:PASTA domain-containing protein n=1 Tax=Granulicella sp. S190 TaxID=1747226 RepID=UPI00131C3EE4|nr:PASTA domain-containing protein [Granulicella sp. S190]